MLVRRILLRLAQARGGPDQQHAGDAAADGGLRQSHIHRKKANPDDRKQQSIGDIANNRGEGSLRGDGPAGDGQNQDGEADVKGLKNCHAAGPLRRAARPMSCAVVAPASWTSAQIATSLNAASTLSVRGSRPSATRPRPRLSALV